MVRLRTLAVPSVIGWRGCLELLRFGLEPDESRFYFAPAEGRNPDELPV